MMKRTLIGLHLVLAAVLTISFFSLRQELNRKPVIPEEGNRGAPDVLVSLFQPPARTAYPHLFDVEAASSVQNQGKRKKNETVGNIVKEAPKELLETPEGMRLRAIFTSLDQRVALVEPKKKRGGPLMEVREKDMVQGYQVQAVTSGYISLLREKDQAAFKLVIFDLDHKKTN